MADQPGRGSSGPLFPPSTHRPKPHSIFEAISEIETLAAVESTGVKLPLQYLLLRQKLAFYEVGLKGGVADIVTSAVFIPLGIAVMDKAIPIFGTYQPSALDEVFALLMGLAFTLCYSLLIAVNLGRCYCGPVSRSAIWTLYGGFLSASLLKSICLFGIFHWIAAKVTPDSLSHTMAQAWTVTQHFVPLETWDHVFYWLVGLRGVLVKAAWIILLGTIICFVIPLVSFWIGGHKTTIQDALKRKYDGY